MMGFVQPREGEAPAEPRVLQKIVLAIVSG